MMRPNIFVLFYRDRERELKSLRLSSKPTSQTHRSLRHKIFHTQTEPHHEPQSLITTFGNKVTWKSLGNRSLKGLEVVQGSSQNFPKDPLQPKL